MSADMAELDIRAIQAEARDGNWDDRTLARRAADTAQDFLPAALRLLRSEERPLLAALGKLAGEEKYRRFLSDLCREILTAPDKGNRADIFARLVRETGGVPPIFNTMDRFRLKTALMTARGSFGATLKNNIRRVLRNTFGGLALPTKLDKVNRCVEAYAKSGAKLLLNPLSPTVFGNRGAEIYLRRLEDIVSKLPGVGLSIQPERLVPGLNPCAPGLGAKALAEKLRTVLRLCTKGGNARPLVVEASTSDILPIVLEAFKTALSQADFYRADVALELPAYLKNASAVLRDLSVWAEERAAQDAPAVKVLLVKGSHLEGERRISAVYGEAYGAFPTKRETEANFKQMIHTAVACKGIRPIIGTHNPFDICYALLDWPRSRRENQPGFAFTAGLGNHYARLLSAAGAEVWATIPVAAEEGTDGRFEDYLLDLVWELARPDGYLCAGYAPEVSSPAWSRMRQQFLAALSGADNGVPEAAEGYRPGNLSHLLDRRYVDDFYAAAQAEQERPQAPLELVLGGQKQDSPLCCIHRSLTAPGQVDYRFVGADYNVVNLALRRAADASKRDTVTKGQRADHVVRLGRALRKHRRDLMALLVRDAGFILADAEAEIRDAVDACNYYPSVLEQDGLQDGTQPVPLGVVVVAPNRTHPLADAVAGIVAAWITGNVVIYKPAAYTSLLGRRLHDMLQKCGMSEPELQYLPALDNQISLHLMTDPLVGGVIHPSEPKNAVHIAGHSDAVLMSQPCGMSAVYLSTSGNWEKAVRDIASTAFRRSGQSADCPHLLLVQAALHDNPRFLAALKDAVLLLRAEPGWREGADVGPLSYLLEESCWHMLTDADDEETWLVQPMTREKGSLVWTPGVRTGVKPGSRFLRHAANLPLLGLVRVADADEAADLQNLLCAGMSAAIYSEDEEEIAHWKQLVHAADIGINCCPQIRIGAHPMGCSSPSLLGATPRPGYRHFLTSLCNWVETAPPRHRGQKRRIPFAPWELLDPAKNDTARLAAAADSLGYWWETEFSTTCELVSAVGETTRLSYRPMPLCLRVEAGMSDEDCAIALMAAACVACKMQVSIDKPRTWMEKLPSLPGISFHEESRMEYETRFPDLARAGYRLRDLAPEPSTRARAAEYRLPLCTAPVLANARLELLHYLQEHTETREAF